PGAGNAGGGKPRSKGERKRGGQRGHRGSRRKLVPEALLSDNFISPPATITSPHF
ncbi:MAG: hypothetical protein RL033_1602, partial [Pseudomonadota bacterium]